MNILIATKNTSYIERIQNALDKTYLYYLIQDSEKLQEIVTIMSDKHYHKEQYELIFIDDKFAQEIQIPFNKENKNLLSIVLLCEHIESLTLPTILNIQTSLILPMSNISAKSINIQIELLLNNIHKVQQIHHCAYTDFLTQIHNRRSFIRNLEELFQIYKSHNIPFCLGFIDLDDFKFINDTFGHLKGDEILESLAKIMKKNCRKTDILARLGGEEFAIIFIDTDIDVAYSILERIRTSIQHTDEIDDSVKVTLSAGLIKVRMEHNSYNELMKDADLLLYKAKDLGKNIVCI